MKAWVHSDSGRVQVPIVFERERPKVPIGFDRQPDSGIEIFKAVPVEELRRYQDAMKERKEGKL